MKLKVVSKKLTALAAMALLCCSAILINSNARGQECPDDTWTSDIAYEFVPGTDCYITVYYCWKWEDGVMHFEFNEFGAPASGPCSGLTPQQMMQGAISQFEAYPPIPTGSEFEFTPCGEGVTQFIHFTQVECWQLASDGAPVQCGLPSGIVAGACLSGEGGCETDIQYCQEPDGTIVELSITTTNTYTGDCPLAPPDGPYVPCLCYDVSPCS